MLVALVQRLAIALKARQVFLKAKYAEAVGFFKAQVRSVEQGVMLVALVQRLATVSRQFRVSLFPLAWPGVELLGKIPKGGLSLWKILSMTL